MRPIHDVAHRRLFKIDMKVEMSSMAELYLPPTLSLVFYLVVGGYLYGDLVRCRALLTRTKEPMSRSLHLLMPV